MCPAGTSIEFTVVTLKDDYTHAIEEWLDYGCLNGIGQWHNSGMGSMFWEKVSDWTTGSDLHSYMEKMKEEFERSKSA